MRALRLSLPLLLAGCVGPNASLNASAALEPCPRILSHRGDTRLYPANTIEAFEAAIDQGFAGVELDVQFSADRVAIVSHDDRLSVATNCSGRISMSRAPDVAPRCIAYVTPLIPESRLLARRSERTALVPRLGQALSHLLSDPRVRSVVVDIKPVTFPEGTIEALRRAIPDCLPRHCAAMHDKITFIAQDARDAGRLMAAFEDAHVALESNETVSGLIDQLDGDHWHDRRFDTYSLSFNSLFDPKLRVVKLLRGENLTPKQRFAAFYERNRRLPEPRRLLGWTINSRAGVAGLHRYRFDEVLTDLTLAEFRQMWRESGGSGDCVAA